MWLGIPPQLPCAGVQVGDDAGARNMQVLQLRHNMTSKGLMKVSGNTGTSHLHDLPTLSKHDIEAGPRSLLLQKQNPSCVSSSRSITEEKLAYT